MALSLGACTTPAPTPAPSPAPSPAPGAGAEDRGAWQALPPSPLSPRAHAHAVWTGEEALLWGGLAPAGPNGMGAAALRDGARYDPRRKRWTPIPDAPIAGGLAGVAQRAFWTGAEMVVIGPADAEDPAWEAARFDPAAGRWRGMALPPLARAHQFDAVWAGDRLVLWTTAALTGRLHVLAWEPAGDRWTVLDPPLPGPRHGVRGLWTGSELVLWGGRPDSGMRRGPACPVVCNERRIPPHDDAVAWAPGEGRWRTLPAVPAELAAGTHAVWAGGHALVHGYPDRQQPRWFRWDPERGEAQPLADLAYGTAIGPVAWTGEALLALRVPPQAPSREELLGLLVLTPDENRWVERPQPPVAAHDGAASVWTGEHWLVWGGRRVQDAVGEVTATATAEGARWDPSAAAEAERPAAGDFDVVVEARLDEGPLTVAAEQPGPLPLGGRAHWPLRLASSEEVYVRPAWGGRGDGVLRHGEGVLLALGPAGGWSVDPAHPELGGQVHAPGIVPDGYVHPDRPLILPMTIVAQEPPFAPAEGEYRQRVALEWWRARPPGTPYRGEPDGAVTLRLVYRLRATTDRGRTDRTGQDAGQAALAVPPCARDGVMLGPADQHAQPPLSVKPDLLGWFGQYAYGAPMAAYRPPGSPAGRTLVGESLVLVNGRPLRECVHPTFAFDATPAQGAQAAEGPAVQTGIVAVDGLHVEVTQFLRGAPHGHELVQRYALRNDGPAAAPLSLARRLVHADTPTASEPRAERGLAEAAAGGEVLRVRSDRGEGPVVEIRGDLDGRARPDAWGVWRDPGSVAARHDVEPMPDGGLSAARSGVVEGDGDGDGRADAAYQPTLVQLWRTTVPAGATVTFTTVTVFRPAP